MSWIISHAISAVKSETPHREHQRDATAQGSGADHRNRPVQIILRYRHETSSDARRAASAIEPSCLGPAAAIIERRLTIRHTDEGPTPEST